MKKLYLLIVLTITVNLQSQTFTTNTSPVGMEHNMLFNASSRYKVTQTGIAKLNVNALFDGRFVPSYTSVGPTVSSPTVVLIENLPRTHIQTGAWVGWSTRYWQAKRFKIEGYDTYGTNTWKTIADYSGQDYSGGTKFVARLSSGAYGKLRFTFYTARGSNGRLGVSELFFIHPEATTPYKGLLSPVVWDNSGGTINYTKGNVGIGTASPDAMLAVNGNIHTKEVKVDLDNWPDYVFTKNHKLPSIEDVESFIKKNGHLSKMPSAKEVKKSGVFLGDMNKKLLEKIEELTLYIIAQNKKNKALESRLIKLEILANNYKN